MNNRHKIKKYICLAVLLLLCLLSSDRRVEGEENTVTMTEFDASESARRSALSGKIVTISTLKEFRLFQKHFQESEDGLAGISFRQEADITPGDYHFTYDAAVDRYWIDLSGVRVGAMDRKGELYKPDGYSYSSIEALGLSDLILQTWSDATWFAGTYDGQGYYFRGFMLGVLDGRGSTYGGLFCDLKGGTIRNVNISDCCMHYCMSPLVNAMYGGTIENCHVSDIVGAAECGGGIAGLLWNGMIRGCTVDHFVFRFRKGYQEGDWYGGIGGVVGVIEQNSGGKILNCQVTNAILYGINFSQVGLGGIVGVGNTGRDGNIVIQDCSASATIYGGRTAGGIIGRIQEDGSGGYNIRNCVCDGSIMEDEDSSASDLGGVLGRLGPNVYETVVEDCVSQIKIEKCSNQLGGICTAGGVIGSVQGECMIDGDVFAGHIHEMETIGSRSQSNSTGGIVGEMKAQGTIVNCVNFADISMGDSQENICGGLVGSVFPEQDVDVVNSLNVGNVTGQTAGGLVGSLRVGSAACRIHNDLTLGESTGQVAGNLAGTALSGDISYCYGRGEMAQAIGSTYQEVEYCRQVTMEQLAGTEPSQPIFDIGNLAGLCSVKEVLNVQVNLAGNQENYFLWENTQAGYPIPGGLENSLPFALRQLDGEWNPPPLVTKRPGPSRPPLDVETPEPPSQETPKPSAQETPEPSARETTDPSGTNLPDPTGPPSGIGTPEPSGSLPGHNPSVSGIPSGAGFPQASASPASGASQAAKRNQQAVVIGFRGKSVNNKSVQLSWKKNTQVSGYTIYRSAKKSSGYRKIKKCTAGVTKFRDKKCKPGKKYYYQIRTLYMQNGKVCQGKTSRCTVKLPYLKNPVFQLSKGKNNLGEKYIQIKMRKYAGKYVDVYLKKEEGRYQKMPMVSHEIALYRKKIRFTYRYPGVEYWCKIKTYKIVKGKKRYSGYSKVRKIRL